jgi:predicted DNA-binding antitoxin AbrB/MazE fold protein
MRQATKTLTRPKTKPHVRRGEIMKTIRAKFSHGVFKPLEKVDYPEDKEFKITVLDEKEELSKEEEARKSFFQFIDEIHERNKDVDPEILEKEIAEAVEAVKKQELKEMASKV